MKIEELILETIGEAKLSMRHSSSYECHARRFISRWGDLLVQEVTPGKLEKWKLERLQSKKPATVRHELAFLSRCFSLAVREGILDLNPVEKISQPSVSHNRIRILSAEEEAELFRVMPIDAFSVVRVFILTCLRRLELFSLRPENLEGRWLNVERAKCEPRRIPLKEEAANILRTWIETHPGGRFVFYPDRGENRFEVGNWFSRKVFNPAKREAGIEDLTIRDLRHTGASRMVRSGIRLYRVQKILGHANIKQTQRYAHLDDQSLLDAVESID